MTAVCELTELSVTPEQEAVCFHCTNDDHPIECLYEFTLASLGLIDTPDMRVLFWDMHGKLEWEEGKERYKVPEFTPSAKEETE